MEYRVGLGYDIHRVDAGRTLVLGGVRFPHEPGLAGHSDGDVLLHAVADALLGAMGAGDIGELFPDTDAAIKGIDSSVILKKAVQLLTERSWRLVNLDAVVICERPKILPVREQLIASLASLLGVEHSRVFVKGKTAERLGPVGSGEGIEVRATVLIARD